MDEELLTRELESIAELMDHFRQPAEGPVMYDIPGDALFWHDEVPPPSERQPPQPFGSALRLVNRYRTTLILGEPDERLKGVWDIARSLLPNWLGFVPERCSPSDELAKEYWRLKREAERECRASLRESFREKRK